MKTGNLIGALSAAALVLAQAAVAQASNVVDSAEFKRRSAEFLKPMYAKLEKRPCNYYLGELYNFTYDWKNIGPKPNSITSPDPEKAALQTELIERAKEICERAKANPNLMPKLSDAELLYHALMQIPDCQTADLKAIVNDLPKAAGPITTIEFDAKYGGQGNVAGTPQGKCITDAVAKAIFANSVKDVAR